MPQLAAVLRSAPNKRSAGTPKHYSTAFDCLFSKVTDLHFTHAPDEKISIFTTRRLLPRQLTCLCFLKPLVSVIFNTTADF